MLLRRGADPRRQDRKGQTAEAFALKKGHKDLADMLADASRSAHHYSPAAALPQQHLGKALRVGKVQRRQIRPFVKALRSVDGEMAFVTLQTDH